MLIHGVSFSSSIKYEMNIKGEIDMKKIIGIFLIFTGFTGLIVFLDSSNFSDLFLASIFIALGIYLFKKPKKYNKSKFEKLNVPIGDVLITKSNTIVSKDNTLVTKNDTIVGLNNNLITKHREFTTKGDEFIVLDFETTGLSAEYDRIIEVAAIKFSDKEMVEVFHTLVNPKRRIPSDSTKIHGITDSMVKGKPNIYDILPDLLDFIGDSTIVAHNARFDMSFLKNACIRYFKDENYYIGNKVVDTLKLSRNMFPDLHNHKLGTVAQHIGIKLENAHRSTDDTFATSQIYIEYLNHLEKEKQIKLDNMDDEERKVMDIVKNILINNNRNIDLFEIRQTSKYFDLSYFYTFLRLKLKGRKQYILSDYDIKDFQSKYGDSYTLEECPKSENAKSRIIITSISQLETMDEIILDSFDNIISQYNKYLEYKDKDESYTITLNIK